MGTILQKVSLHGARFFAFHGFYPEEQLTGAEFIVDVETELEVFSSGEDDLLKTLNYERLYTIVSAQMSRPRKLIETVAHDILEDIRHEFISVKNIHIAVRKNNPPVGGEVENAAVELIFNR